MPATRASADAQARWNIYMPADRETATFDYGVPAELAKRKARGTTTANLSPLCDRSGGDPVRYRGTSGRARARRLDAGR